ncbi:MAG: hypothetical protein KAR20_01735, partial [Candidatus Heimdallarchaeota archaeon]|nr:hypothetical protein [Candidatus Heimdallarchaeota archaeon]
NLQCPNLPHHPKKLSREKTNLLQANRAMNGSNLINLFDSWQFLSLLLDFVIIKEEGFFRGKNISEFS